MKLPNFESVAGDDRGFRPVLTARVFWIVLLISMAAGSTWHVRNWALTGNPVYAFFPKLFPNSVNINPEVLQSAELEWFRNGDGIGQGAELFADIEAGRDSRDIHAGGFEREGTLRNKLQASWWFWQGFETFAYKDDDAPRIGRWVDRLYYLSLIAKPGVAPTENRIETPFGVPVRLLLNRHVYKMAPLIMGFCIPGALIGLLLLFRRRAAIVGEMQALHRPAFEVGFVATFATAFCFLGFHYLLGDFYLYQIISWLPALAVLGAVPFVILFSARNWIARIIQVGGMIVIIVAAIVPGVAMALMGFKIPGGGTVSGQTFSAIDLDVFRNPGMSEELFYRLRFGDEVEIWEQVNKLAKGQPLLTHDNRHLLFDPSIQLVHLDDWDVQTTYEMTSAKEKLDFFMNRGIRYYLRIPNERSHPVNQRVGLDQLIRDGYLKLVDEAGGSGLYRFMYPENDASTSQKQ